MPGDDHVRERQQALEHVVLDDLARQVLEEEVGLLLVDIERDAAARLRDAIDARFAVQIGRWHDVPVGPHTQAMYQVAFDVAEFAAFVPWLALERASLSVLVHPNTLAPRDDHLRHALWLGMPLALKGDVLPEAIEEEDESAVVPNTTAARASGR